MNRTVLFVDGPLRGRVEQVDSRTITCQVPRMNQEPMSVADIEDMSPTAYVELDTFTYRVREVIMFGYLVRIASISNPPRDDDLFSLLVSEAGKACAEGARPYGYELREEQPARSLLNQRPDPFVEESDAVSPYRYGDVLPESIFGEPTDTPDGRRLMDAYERGGYEAAAQAYYALLRQRNEAQQRRAANREYQVRLHTGWGRRATSDDEPGVDTYHARMPMQPCGRGTCWYSDQGWPGCDPGQCIHKGDSK